MKINFPYILYRSEEEVKEYRKQHNITVSCPAGFEIPRPIQHFSEANFPKYVTDVLKLVSSSQFLSIL